MKKIIFITILLFCYQPFISLAQEKDIEIVETPIVTPTPTPQVVLLPLKVPVPEYLGNKGYIPGLPKGSARSADINVVNKNPVPALQTVGENFFLIPSESKDQVLLTLQCQLKNSIEISSNADRYPFAPTPIRVNKGLIEAMDPRSLEWEKVSSQVDKATSFVLTLLELKPDRIFLSNQNLRLEKDGVIGFSTSDVRTFLIIVAAHYGDAVTVNLSLPHACPSLVQTYRVNF